ncbi:MAG: PilZ domain-containing protein [Desulfovibrionaceae bacterium]
MTAQENGERRKHVRLTIRAYGYDYECRLEHQGALYRASLIDIALGGARLKLLHPIPASLPNQEDTVNFSLPDAGDELGLDRVDSTVRWVKDHELGIQFDQEPRLSLSDLQRVMAP